jgi:hypothetical protein
LKLHEIVFLTANHFTAFKTKSWKKVSTIKNALCASLFFVQLFVFISRSVREHFVGSFFTALGFARPFGTGVEPQLA